MKALQITTHINIGGIANYVLNLSEALQAKGIGVIAASSGGNLEDVEIRQTIVAGTDPVALDAWAAREFFGLAAERLPYLDMCARRGLGRVEGAATMA